MQEPISDKEEKNSKNKLTHGGSITKLLNIKVKETALKGPADTDYLQRFTSTTALARKEWNNSLEMLGKNKFKLSVL